MENYSIFTKTQIKVYEDWPHHLLLKTCYRTSANLSDGSVWSQPAYRFMFIHGCIHANSTLIELVFRNICRIGSRDISKCSDKNLIQIVNSLHLQKFKNKCMEQRCYV
ncbi:hypothetical protein NQ317_016314 [Molorchus minor]|uniref:Uncharacterized protein n=1 Tax=Molorchus minor TaxID=1323400 RepID=A0ABQ9K8F0_9CUCU|nr:hypothetical protein NQ317_016314 [Molorchus minor]